MKKIVLSILLSLPFIGQAGGFQLNVQGVRAIGMGGAFTGIAYGPASLFFNPGGMTSVMGHQFNFGVNYVSPLVALQTDIYDNIRQTTGYATPFHFYYTGQVTDKLSVGLGINNQFGSSSSFDDDWQGKFIIQNVSLRTFMFQPTVAYKLHEKLSIGGGFVYTKGTFTTEKAIPLGSATIDYGKARLEGAGVGFGFNFGIHSNTIDTDKMKLSLGFDYRSGTKLDLPEGTATFTDIPVSLQGTFPASTGFSSQLKLPSVISFGLAYTYNLTEDFSAMFAYDYNYTAWSSYDSLNIDFVNENTPDSKNEKNWQNVGAHRFGLEFSYQQKYALRVGGYYDNTPILDGYVSPELPDADQFVFTMGAGVKVGDILEFDVSWIHQDSEREASLDAANFSAKYRRIADVISFSTTIKLGQGKKTKEPSI